MSTVNPRQQEIFETLDKLVNLFDILTCLTFALEICTKSIWH